MVCGGNIGCNTRASDQLRGTPIVVTDRRGDAWTTTLTAVVSRSDTEIVVTNTGRPRR